MIMRPPRRRTSPERHGDLTRAMPGSSKCWNGCDPGVSAAQDSCHRPGQWPGCGD